MRYALMLWLLVWSQAWGESLDFPRDRDPIFRLETGQHGRGIRRIASDREGRWLATASLDKTVRVWNARTGELTQVLRPPIPILAGTRAYIAEEEGEAYSVAISPDGSVVAVGGHFSLASPKGVALYFFDRASGQQVGLVTGLPDTPGHLAFSGDGRFLAAGLNGKKGILVVSVADRKVVGSDTAFGDKVDSVEFRPNNEPAGMAEATILVTSQDGSLRLYRLAQNALQLVAKLAKLPGGPPYSARFSPDGKKVVVGHVETNVVTIHSAADLALVQTLGSAGLNGNMAAVAWSPDGDAIFAAGNSSGESGGREKTVIRRWSGSHFSRVDDWPAADDAVGSLVALPQQRLAFATFNAGWGVLDDQGRLSVVSKSRTVDVNGDPTQFAISADGSQVRFRLSPGAAKAAVFDLKERRYLDAEPAGLISPRLRRKRVYLTNLNDDTPHLNGIPLRGDGLFNKPGPSISGAISPRGDERGDFVIIGSLMALRRFSFSGEGHWFRVIPDGARAVNVTEDGKRIVVAYGDGTIRWHNAINGEEELAFYPHPDGQRWVVWSADGYYDASHGGESLLGWHLNQAYDKAPRFIGSNQLYDVFYRPDIIQARFRGEDVSSLVTLTAEQALKAPPPLVALTQLPARSAGPREKVCYKVTAAGGGIGEVRVFHNGKLVKSDGFYREAAARREDSLKLATMDAAAVTRSLRALKLKAADLPNTPTGNKGEVVTECQEIEPVAGPNEIGVVAFNAQNTVQSSMAQGAFTSTRPAEEPHLHVLAIGIDQFADPSANLKFAGKDAQDILDLVRQKSGAVFKPANVHQSSLKSAQATKQGILKKIDEMAGRIRPGDTFILFIASHGVLLGNQYYLVGAGYDGTADRKHLIGSNEIVDLSKKIKALNQLFIFDTCHAGGVDNIVGGLYDSRMSVMAKKMGLHIYAAAGGLQEALDGFQGNGLFTHALLKSVRAGAATDFNKDNAISIIELGESARRETMAISRTLGHPQSPSIISFGKDSLLFPLRPDVPAAATASSREDDALWADLLERSRSAAPVTAYLERKPNKLGEVRACASAGNADCQADLARLYYNGWGVEENPAEAFAWAKKSAGQGNRRGQNSLGAYYQFGVGTERNPAEAVKWFRQSAAQGYSRAQLNLGRAYASGNGGLAKDDAEAVNWYRKAVDQGNSTAQAYLGSALLDGRGAPKDVAEGIRLLRLAADQGEAVAQNSLAKAYLEGQGVPKDASIAYGLIRKAAESGDATGEFNLGVLYAQGTGVAKDDVEAVKWYRKAAERGHVTAQSALGNAYRLGRGVEQDLPEAEKWLRKAAEKGNESAQERLKLLLAAKPATGAPSAPGAPGASSAPGGAFKDCADCPDMMKIPGGSFEMGGTRADELPVHRVDIKPFALGRTEVTQAQWRAVMGSDVPNLKFPGCDACPVERVNWSEIQGFLQKLGAKTGKPYRLPSEAEWEYACRAGGRHRYCGSDDIGAIAWTPNNSDEKTHPVGQKQANAFGLHDMAGNVWEMTSDCLNKNYVGAPNDGTAWTAGDCYSHMARGGGWGNIADSGYRNYFSSGQRDSAVGFRVALPISGATQ